MKKGATIVVVIIIVILVAAAYYFLTAKKTVEPIVWDGSYQMSGELICTGDIPNLTSIPMTTMVVVSSNKIVDQLQGVTKTFDIDENGKATETIEPTTANGVTTGGTADYQFYQEEEIYKFTSTGAVDISMVKDGKTFSSTCSGTITGVKQ